MTQMAMAKKVVRGLAPQHVSAAQDPDALLTVHTVATLTGFAEDTIREWGRDGHRGFPAPIHIGRYVRWRAGDVREWMQKVGIKPPEA